MEIKKKKVIIFHHVCLTFLRSLLEFNNISNILLYKFQNHFTICDKCGIKIIINNKKEFFIDEKTGEYVKTNNFQYKDIEWPNFLLFIMDMGYEILKFFCGK